MFTREYRVFLMICHQPRGKHVIEILQFFGSFKEALELKHDFFVHVPSAGIPIRALECPGA